MATHHEHQREALLAQCAYLIDEAAALRRLLPGIPADFLEARPMNKWSIKETLGHLADCDIHIFLPRLRRMVAEEEPAFADVDQDHLVVQHGWNDRPIAIIFDALQEGRASIIQFLEALSAVEWARIGHFPDGVRRNIYDLALSIARHDAHHLRAIGYRLHESHITSRPTDLPK